jgi:glycerol-3-phosphate O-acyltransferase / dihydroxyacetone phosphate acyltransferase
LLERLVIALIRVVTNTFFRRIDIVGAENIPPHGPVIFAGNHPNALMDGWLLTAKTGRRPLHFMANAKLWNYRLLVPVLDACGAVPVYPREEYGDTGDNERAFSRLYDVIESGNCVGIFPEGISHADSRLARLKTGTARLALAVGARGKAAVSIIPCGLNYIHRHRFRSQVLLEFGTPIVIDADRVREYEESEQHAVRRLTDELAAALASVTLNAPDWRTLRIIQTARRLYKPSAAALRPREYMLLNRRFVEAYLADIHEPELQALSLELEDYQARLDLLGLKDHQLRRPVSASQALRKVVARSFTMLLLLPLAIPGALLHLPIGWIAASVSHRFSYEMDDIATLKVLATMLLLPIVYLIIAISVGIQFGALWALVAVAALTFSFFASVRLIEAEASLLVSMLAMLRLTRLRGDVEELQSIRSELVRKIRVRVDQRVGPDTQRIFRPEDFATGYEG